MPFINGIWIEQQKPLNTQIKILQDIASNQAKYFEISNDR